MKFIWNFSPEPVAARKGGRPSHRGFRWGLPAGPIKLPLDGRGRAVQASGDRPRLEPQLQLRLDHCSFLATQMCVVVSHASILSEECCTWELSAPGKKELPTRENAERAEARRPTVHGPAEGGFRRSRKSARGATAAPQAGAHAGCAICPIPVLPVHPRLRYFLSLCNL